MAWQPLSVRTGKRQPTGPYEGVPPHLRDSLIRWIGESFIDEDGTLIGQQLLRYIALMNEVVVPPGTDEFDLFNQMNNLCATDDDFCLDLIDSMLHSDVSDIPRVQELAAIFIIGNSVWAVKSDYGSLERRVDQSAASQFSMVTSPEDAASTELKEAWTNAYGRHPDASDAWDHAIKAVEAILIPIVCPKKNKANLGRGW